MRIKSAALLSGERNSTKINDQRYGQGGWLPLEAFFAVAWGDSHE